MKAAEDGLHGVPDGDEDYVKTMILGVALCRRNAVKEQILLEQQKEQQKIREEEEALELARKRQLFQEMVRVRISLIAHHNIIAPILDTSTCVQLKEKKREQEAMEVARRAALKESELAEEDKVRNLPCGIRPSGTAGSSLLRRMYALKISRYAKGWKTCYGYGAAMLFKDGFGVGELMP